ncbi:MAG: lipoyl domain-containing protein, partial [Clostridia bacterium]|nr:lipoyl domain-containing protein [Clostridia bacterium]
MLKKIIMPSAGQTTDTATVTQICVAVGDKIDRGHVVAEVETDKATLPVESFAAGYVCAIHVSEFEIIDAGALMFE